jgi:hypothetical protein
MVAEPVGDCPLHRHDVPSRIVRRIGVGEHILGLRELPCVRERLAIFAQHVEILRRLDSCGLDDGDGLVVSGESPQGPRIFDRSGLLAWVTVVTFAQFLRVGPELRVVRRVGCRPRNGAGDVTKVVAAGKRRGEGCEACDEERAQDSGAKGRSRHRGPQTDGNGVWRASASNLA